MIKMPDHISPSQIDMFNRCAEQYRRRYILGEKIPPGVSLLRGASVHKGIEENNKYKLTNKEDLPERSILELIDFHFDDYKNRSGYVLTREEESIGASKVLGEAKDMAIAMGKVYYKDSAPNVMPELVESKVEIEFPKIKLIGILDLADDKQRVIEYKTGKRWTQGRADKSFQLSFYGMAYKVLKGIYPRELIIGNFINNKKPVYSEISTQRDENDCKVLYNRINTVLDAIQKGVFTPCSSDSWQCSEQYCGFALTCPYYNKK